MSATDYQTRGRVAVISMQNPPVNGLGLALREGIVESLDQANGDASVEAIVLIGAHGTFSGGADIREFNTPAMFAEPSLATVIEAIEASPKPVIAAISGACMGGGLELALGCHARIAAPDAQIALPEVKLGLLPGAGGTQRLPRVIGLEAALNMIVSGNIVPAKLLAETDLFDTMAGDDLLADATRLAEQSIGQPLKLVRDRKVKHPESEGFLMVAKNTVATMAGPFPAPVKCVEAVAASTGKFDAGIATERKLFGELVQTPESKALRHAFFGERAASKIKGVPADTPTRPIETVAVIGAGTMGGGITMNFLNAGIPVRLLEMSQEALDRGIGIIRKNYEGRVKKGKLTEEKLEQRMALIHPTLSYDDLGDTDLVIEAVFEDMGVKQQVFETLDAVMKPGAILASNTSTLDLDKIASFTKRPEDVVGLHFFSPANVMRLLEVVRGEKTADDVLVTVMKLGKTIRKLCVVAGVCDGFIGNRMVNKYIAQAIAMLEEGALPQEVDKAVESIGFAMGPFRMCDLSGNDVGWYIRKRHYEEYPDMPRMPIADKLCEMGRFGQKTGSGWYKYVPGDRKAHPDPEVEKLIVDTCAELGVERRKLSQDEIRDRLVLALVNEGARILEDGIAQRASDIDMVYLNGYGFPLHLGGPMLYADTMGLYNVERRMRQFAALPGADATFWEPAELVKKLASDGKMFN
ncbi:3-hydroxyacyl-CoA dehydrogenase NAD-binding domain-containing protein [uncultured Abyssibacter sp.]|uniref:3-hydroxyacyl-CoA dehydrogenase NAD-binding domain-containing protein n=1 Tax=uncultured Abyssibacter sp. TaxID=2320202 RepID=UPI0032B235E7